MFRWSDFHVPGVEYLFGVSNCMFCEFRFPVPGVESHAPVIETSVVGAESHVPRVESHVRAMKSIQKSCPRHDPGS